MPYNPQDDAIPIGKPFGPLGINIDSRAKYWDKVNFVRRPYISTAEVLAYFDDPNPVIKNFKREGEFVVFVNSTGTLNPNGTITGGEKVAYWWKEGTADNQLVEVVEKGDKGDAFTFDDFTPEEIELLQQPALDAAETANTATNNANTATSQANTARDNANTAASSANTATSNANTATSAANTATTNANTATSQANDARDEALAAAIVANGARGWQPEYGLESDGLEREVQKLIRWVGGTGGTPIDYVGKYIGSTGFVDTKAEATNVKGDTGEQGIQGISTPNMVTNKLLGRYSVGTGTPQELDSVGLTIGSDGKFYNGIEVGGGASKVATTHFPADASWGQNTGVGSVRIKLTTVGDAFLLISGTIYFYDGISNVNRSCEFFITSYPTAIGNGYSANFLGKNPPDFPVYFYKDGADRYIYIGDLTQDWLYSSVSIDLAKATYSGASLVDIASGWAITLETAFEGTLMATSTNNLPKSNQQQIITDFVVGADVAVVNTDTKAQARGKFQAQINAIKANYKYGSITITGNGSITVFNIPHGLGSNPSSLNVRLSDNSNTNLFNGVITKDATNIIITCSTAPVVGSQLVFWQVYK